MELLAQPSSKWEKFKLKIVIFWQSLTLPEKLYTASFVLLIFQQGDTLLPAILTAIGLTMEFWPRFTRAWESLAGKAIILLFYAVIANFALVSSASIVNEITGVAATNLTYTHNLAILLILPSWALGISVIALFLYQLFVPLYLVLILLAKPFGIKVVRFFSKSKHPFFSNTLRFIVCFTLLYQFSTMLTQSVTITKLDTDLDFSLLADTKTGVNVKELDAETLAKLDNVKLDNAKLEANAFNINISQDNEQNADIADTDFSDTDFSDIDISNTDEQGYEDIIRQLIAYFAYYFEADTHSRCKKPDDVRVIELNEYEALFITKNSEAKYSLDFTVDVCDSPAIELFKNR